MLDINDFRTDKGGNPEVIRESQRRRFANVELVDQVLQLDTEWRDARTKLNFMNKRFNSISKTVAQKMKAKEPLGDNPTLPQSILDDVTTITEEICKSLTIVQLKALSTFLKEQIAKFEATTVQVEQERDRKIVLIGNIVHESVPVSKNEDENAEIRKWGEFKSNVFESGTPLLNHVDLMTRLDGIDTVQGALVAGSRGYYMKGPMVLLNLAIIQYGIAFLAKRGYTPLWTPFFMNKQIMGEVAQLEQFDEELYKVTGEGDDKYLIATSEQPIAAFHRESRIEAKELPIRYVGFSSCFRKEVGSHGKDTLGIFRIHQFEKLEQFCITSPEGDNSWRMQEEMINNSEEFYQSLGIPYHIVCIVSGALNNAAAKKLDLEAWFPASQKFRELVSCSNCTDYQSRRLNVRFGGKNVEEKQFVHMLNSTLTATERTMCCIVENYQTETGVRVPDVLVPFVGKDFLPFTKELSN